MKTKNNILLVLMDQWSGKRLGISGNKFIQTPTLDQLAKNGTLYTNAYSEAPICIPARRSLYTGTSPRTHGDRIFKKTNSMPKNLKTFPECFVNAGYQAFCVGKLHVYPARDRIGFQEAIIAEEGRPHLGIDDYDIFLAENGNPGQFRINGIYFENRLSTFGEGFSAQFGMISKISDVIRIGFTYDTPTWFTITEETTQYLETSMTDEFDENSLLVTNPNAINVYEDYTIQMPSKITASGAFVFKNFGLISFDYSRKDYGSMKFKPENDNYFSNFIYQYYSTHKIPKFIIVNDLPENQKLLESLLSEQSGFTVKIMTPTRGKKNDIMNLILKECKGSYGRG